jgi:hypothetical protein
VIDPDTAGALLIGKGYSASSLGCLEYLPSTDTLCALSASSNELFAIDINQGTTSALGTPIVPGNWRALCVEQSSGELIASNASNHTLHRVTPSDSGSEFIFPLAASPRSLAHNPGINAPVASSSQQGFVGVHPTLGAAVGLDGLHGDVPTNLAFDPVTKRFYSIGEPAFGYPVWSYDENGGNRTLESVVLGGYGPIESDLAYDPGSHRLYTYFAGGTALSRINPSDGSWNLIGSTSGFGNISGLTFDPTGSGVLYGYAEGSDELIRISTSTGSGSSIGTVGKSVPIGGLGFDDVNGVLYGCSTSSPYELSKIDTETGVMESIGVTRWPISGMAYRP